MERKEQQPMRPEELRSEGWIRLTEAQPPLDGPNALMVADDDGRCWWKYAPVSTEVANHAAAARLLEKETPNG